MEARAAQFLARSAERHRAAHPDAGALSLDERLARAEASRAAALSHKAAAAGADVRHAMEVAAVAATAADRARSAAETQLELKLRLASERRSTSMFRKRERGTTECSRAKAVAQRMRHAKAATTNAARRHLQARLVRAERRRAAALAARTRSAHVGNARVEMAAWRRRCLTVGDGSASDSSDGEGVSDAAMSPARSGAGAGAGAGASPSSEVSPVSSASSDDFGFGTSPPRRRRRHHFGFGADEDGSVPKTWYEAAASPRRRAWREAQRRLERAEERRVTRQAAKAERTRRRERTAAARVADNLASQAAARAQARQRLFAALDAATHRREEALAGVVRRVRTHSEDVAERAARVRGAKAVISAMIKRRHRRTASKPQAQEQDQASTKPASPPAAPAPKTDPAPPPVPQRGSPADAKPAAVKALVRGKTMMSMLRTLHRVVQRSSPSAGAAASSGAGAGAGAGADKKDDRFTFTRCTRIMQQKKVVLAFRGLAALVTKATEEVLGVPDASQRASSRPPVQRGAKTLMAAVMIAHYPEEMFEQAALQDGDSVESRLVRAGTAVVGAMRVLGAVAHPESKPNALAAVAAVQMFHRAWLTYMDTFAAWKSKDGAVLAAQMGPGFVQLELTRRMYAAQLDELRREVEAAGGDDTSEQLEATQQLLAGVGSHMAVMRRQLTNLLGEQGALEWERDAVRQLDEELGDEPLPLPPRVTFRNASNAGKRKLSTDSADSTDSSGSSGGRPRVAPSSTLSSDAAASSPPRRVRTRTRRQGDGRMMRNLMSNVALVHRLVLDPGYRFPTVDRPACLAPGAWASGPGECTCTTAAATDQASLVRCAKHWERKYGGAADRDELTNLVVAELRVVRTDLAKLTPNRKDLAEELTNTLDLQYLADNLRADTYSTDAFATLVSFLADRIAQLEAPARSESTHQWAGTACDAIRSSSGAGGTSLTQQLALVTAWLHFKLAQIRVDIMNFQLSTLAPFLSSDGRGSEYERKKFEEARGRGELSMAGTALWLRDAVSAAVERAGGAASVSGKALLADVRVTSREARLKVLLDAVEALLSRPVALISQAAAASAGGKPTPDSYFPETMRLDAEALTGMQNTLQRVALSASLTATVKQVLASARASAAASSAKPTAPAAAASSAGPSTVEELEAALDDWLRADDMNLGDLQEGVVSAAQQIAASTAPLSPEQVAMLRRGVEQAASTSHPVFATFHSRALRVVRDRLCARLAIDAAGGATSSTSAVARRSLASALPQLHKLADKLARIITHNEKVFAGHYSALLSGIAVQLAGGATNARPGAGAGAGAGAGSAASGSNST